MKTNKIYLILSTILGFCAGYLSSLIIELNHSMPIIWIIPIGALLLSINYLYIYLTSNSH